MLPLTTGLKRLYLVFGLSVVLTLASLMYLPSDYSSAIPSRGWPYVYFTPPYTEPGSACSGEFCAQQNLPDAHHALQLDAANFGLDFVFWAVLSAIPLTILVIIKKLMPKKAPTGR
jgi:hypothetical protein